MKIIINEKQEKCLHKFFLKEAMGDMFSFDELKKINSFKGKYNYCKKTLGPTQGRGSSRVCFQLSDNKILKLALNQKGLAQNATELDWGLQSYDVVPEIYPESDTDNYTFICSEYVLPAKESDFEHVFGFDFHTFCKCITAFYNCYTPHATVAISPMDDDSLSTLLDENEDLNSFYYYMTDYQPPLGDMLSLSSYGMTNRSGVPQIVLLDSGLNYDVFNKFYKRR